MEWLKQLLTGADNKTHDLGRWSWAGSFIAVTSAGIWNACHSITFDLVQVASAFGALAASHGIALMAKKGTEPESKQ